MVVNKTKDIDTKNKSDFHWFTFWFDLTNWITQSVNHSATEMVKQVQPHWNTVRPISLNCKSRRFLNRMIVLAKCQSKLTDNYIAAQSLI